MSPFDPLVLERIVAIVLIHEVGATHSMVISRYQSMGVNLSSFPSKSSTFSQNFSEVGLKSGEHMNRLVILPCSEVDIFSIFLHTLDITLDPFSGSFLRKYPISG